MRIIIFFIGYLVKLVGCKKIVMYTFLSQQTFFVLLALVFSFHTNLLGQTEQYQDNWQYFNSKYGVDPELYNGVKYFPSHTQAEGHPFLLIERPVVGEVVMSGKKYTGLTLNYDIYNQQLILNYTNYTGAFERIVINSSLVDTFYIAYREFVQNPFPEIAIPYLQLIYKGKISAFVGWSKIYEFRGTIKSGQHEYSDEKKSFYLVKNSEVYKFRNRRTFIKHFDDSQQKQVKVFLKNEKMKIRKATDFQLQQLLIFCNNLN